MALDPLDLLTELQRREVEDALADPAQRERFLVAAVVQVRDDVAGLKLRDSNAREYCRDTCGPAIDKRFGRLERFRSWLLGIGIGFGSLITLAGLLWAIFGK